MIYFKFVKKSNMRRKQVNNMRRKEGINTMRLIMTGTKLHTDVN